MQPQSQMDVAICLQSDSVGWASDVGMGSAPHKPHDPGVGSERAAECKHVRA